MTSRVYNNDPATEFRIRTIRLLNRRTDIDSRITIKHEDLKLILCREPGCYMRALLDLNNQRHTIFTVYVNYALPDLCNLDLVKEFGLPMVRREMVLDDLAGI